MRRSKPQTAIRNKLDMTDQVQVRILKRHLGVSDEDLVRIVAKSGNSIAVISKQVENEKARKLNQDRVPTFDAQQSAKDSK